MALQMLLGVIEDGSCPCGAAVPKDPRKTLRLAQRQDTTLRLQLLRANGQPAEILIGDVLTFVVRKCPGANIALSKIAVPKPALGRGWADFTVGAADLRNVCGGWWFHEVVRTSGGQQDSVIPASPLLICPTLAP